jgi:integral membrane protein (TIGR01906 family)
VRAPWLVSIATAFVVLGASVVVFLNPIWIGFEQDRTQVTYLTGYSAADVRAVSASILGDLVLDAGDFDVTAQGVPVLTEPERQHMRDVRGVFAGFGLLVLASALLLALTWRRSPAGEGGAWWRAVRSGAAGLAIVVAILGAVSIVAFDAAFEVFHRLFFTAGTYQFDPETSRLVQLFPDQFWNETAVAVGAVAVALAVLTTWISGRRADGGLSASAEAVSVRVGPVTR